MKILKFLDENIEKYFLWASLVAVVILIFMQVVLRYVFNYSLAWAEELSRYILLYQIWVGTAYCVKKDAHIRMNIIQSKLSPKNQIKMEIFVTVLWMIFTLFLTLKSGQLTSMLYANKQISPAMQIPMAIAYASVPIGCGLMVFRLCQKLYKDVIKLEKQEAELR